MAADVANDPSTAGAAASAGADLVYSDTLPAQQENAKSADPVQAAKVGAALMPVTSKEQSGCLTVTGYQETVLDV